MEQSVLSLAFKGSVIDAILEAKRKKKLFVVYVSGNNPESSNLEKSTWLDLSLAEVFSKYCILLQISEDSADAANLSAIYPQKCSPCITVIGYNGLQLWQNEGFCTAEVLTSSLEKAWLNLHLQETAAGVLTAALAAQKTELPVQGNSGYNLLGQGTSSTSDTPSTLMDNHTPYQDVGTHNNFNTVDKKEHLPVKKVNLEVGDNLSPAPVNDPGRANAEQASSSNVNESLDPVNLEPENIINDDIGCRPVQETNLISLRSEGKRVASTSVDRESQSAVQGESSSDNKNDDRDFSLDKSDVQLNIRLPDCTSLQEKFSLTSTLREVKNYVDKKQDISLPSYDLAIPYPRKVFGNEDLDKTFSELGLFDRQALILIPHSKFGGYPKEGSIFRNQTSEINNPGSSSGSSEGYFSSLKRIISYMNPFSYIGRGTNSPSSILEPQSSTWQYRPSATPQNSLRNAGPNQHASSASNGNRNRPTFSGFGSNIHTLKHDEDDNKTRDKNAFWNGNSTQYGGDSDGK